MKVLEKEQCVENTDREHRPIEEPAGYLLRLLSLLIILVVFVTVASCDYARMRDQESIRTWEEQMPDMPKNTIPVEGGYQVLKNTDPSTLKNKVPPTTETIERGRLAYAYFCIQCHGVKLDGFGTVGQSFSPLPADLTSGDVLEQSDGELYYKIRMGYNRHPPLFDTIPEDDTWSVVNYMRALHAGKGK